MLVPGGNPNSFRDFSKIYEDFIGCKIDRTGKESPESLEITKILQNTETPTESRKSHRIPKIGQFDNKTFLLYNNMPLTNSFIRVLTSDLFTILSVSRHNISPSRSSVGRASESQPAPGSSPGSRRFGARYIEPPDGDGLRSGQRPQPVEVSERGGPCPAMWAR